MQEDQSYLYNKLTEELAKYVFGANTFFLQMGEHKNNINNAALITTINNEFDKYETCTNLALSIMNAVNHTVDAPTIKNRNAGYYEFEATPPYFNADFITLPFKQKIKVITHNINTYQNLVASLPDNPYTDTQDENIKMFTTYRSLAQQNMQGSIEFFKKMQDFLKTATDPTPRVTLFSRDSPIKVARLYRAGQELEEFLEKNTQYDDNFLNILKEKINIINNIYLDIQKSKHKSPAVLFDDVILSYANIKNFGIVYGIILLIIAALNCSTKLLKYAIGLIQNSEENLTLTDKIQSIQNDAEKLVNQSTSLTSEEKSALEAKLIESANAIIKLYLSLLQPKSRPS